MKTRKHNSKSLNDLLNSITPLESEQTRVKMFIAAKIDDALIELNMTPRDLANKMHEALKHVEVLMSGTYDFTVEKVVKIAFILDKPVGYFFESNDYGLSNVEVQNSNLVKPILCPVIFNGRKFFGIREFDCHLVGLFTEKTLKGTFFTVIPISDIEHRKKSPTKAKVEIETNDEWTIFKIYSDWGQCHKIEIHNSLSKEIEIARQRAVEHGLL